MEFNTFKNSELAGNFAVFENTSTKYQISIDMDSNRGYSQKYNYDFKIYILYNKKYILNYINMQKTRKN